MLQSRRNQLCAFNTIVACLAISFGLSSAWAQRSSIGLNAGIFMYNGDLNRSVRFEEATPAGGLFYRYQLTDLLGFRGGLSFGLLGSSDANSTDVLARARGASFRTALADVHGLVEYRFWREYDRLDRALPVLYVFAGVGGVVIPQPEEITEDFSAFQPIIPFGLGVNWRFLQNLVLGVEITAHKTFFDYLDGVSGGPGAKDYNYGDRYSQDWYHFVGISLSYIIYSVRCPVPIQTDSGDY